MLHLSKTRRNSLYEVIAVGPLNVSECAFEDQVGLFKVHHSGSGSDFEIYLDQKSPFRIWSVVGDEGAPDREWEVGSFGNVLESASKWAKDVAAWVDAPDLWELNVSGSAAVPGEIALDTANTLFTSDERAAISGQLKAIAESVKVTHQLTTEQSAKLDEKFEEAEKASQRMGRKDWGLLFGGAVFSLILADIITPSLAGHILMMIQHGIGYLFSGPSVRGVLSSSED